MPRDYNSLEHTDVRAESVVEGSSTGHATMVGSYREPSYATFPKYSSVSSSFGVPQIYCRSLLPSGNGFAPSNITGDVRRPEEHFGLGACIGDVGYVDEYGAFVYCFNIFCERNDEIQAMDLPLDFVPFSSSFPTEAVTYCPDYHLPGTIIASEGIHVSRISDSPLKANFTSSMSEGAVLILPSGASREDLVYPQRLYDYVKLNAMKWYQLCNKVDDEKGTRAHNVPNGTLHLVTGVDRAASWATATFPYRRMDGPLSFQYSEDSDPTWINSAGLRTLYRHNKESSMDGSLGAVFLRFMSISVRPTQCTRNSNASSASVVIPRYVLPTVQKPMSRSVFSRFRGPVKISPCPPEFTFDPSIILLQVLLRMDTTASVAIVFDSVWRADLSHQQMSHLELVALMNRILKHNRVVDIDGMATFARRSLDKKSQSSTPLWMKLIPCIRFRRKHAPGKGEEAALKEVLKIISG